MSDMYVVSTSDIMKRSTTGLVSLPACGFRAPLLDGSAMGSSWIVLVRDQIASVHLGNAVSVSAAADDFNSPTFPRLNSRTNSTRASARIGGGSSSGGAKIDEERGGEGT